MVLTYMETIAAHSGKISPAPNHYCPFLLQHTAHPLAVGGDDYSIAMHNPRTNRAHSGEAHSKSNLGGSELYPEQGTELCIFNPPCPSVTRRTITRCTIRSNDRSHPVFDKCYHHWSLNLYFIHPDVHYTSYIICNIYRMVIAQA